MLHLCRIKVAHALPRQTSLVIAADPLPRPMPQHPSDRTSSGPAGWSRPWAPIADTIAAGPMFALTNSGRWRQVALAYIADPERLGWRAYRSVYPNTSHRAAVTGFTRLLTNADFSARIAELAEEVAPGAVMTAQQVLEELSKIGRANMADNMADFVRAFACRDPVAAVDHLKLE
jgi:hypothetical protein